MINKLQSPSIITTTIEELQQQEEHLSLEQLQRLVKLVDQSDIVGLEVTHSAASMRLILRKANLSFSELPVAEPLLEEAPASKIERSLVTAPCVGFCQLWARVKTHPLVTVGDTVKAGQQVALIRSLVQYRESGSHRETPERFGDFTSGVLSEVEAPVAGRIAEIFVQDGQPIEYGQPLMAIEN